jgi:hypothetical protein
MGWARTEAGTKAARVVRIAELPAEAEAGPVGKMATELERAERDGVEERAEWLEFSAKPVIVHKECVRERETSR